jgi:hypothetical protein
LIKKNKFKSKMSEQDAGEKPAEEEPVEPKIILTQDNIE